MMSSEFVLVIWLDEIIEVQKGLDWSKKSSDNQCNNSMSGEGQAKKLRPKTQNRFIVNRFIVDSFRLAGLEKMGITHSPLPQNNGNLSLTFFGGNYLIVILHIIYW